MRQFIGCSTEDCRGLMRLIGNASAGGAPLRLYYHCSECGGQATVDIKTGQRGGRFTENTLTFFVRNGILNGLGEPGPKYPHHFPKEDLNPIECPRCSSADIEMTHDEPRHPMTVVNHSTGWGGILGDFEVQGWVCHGCDYDWYIAEPYGETDFAIKDGLVVRKDGRPLDRRLDKIFNKPVDK